MLLRFIKLLIEKIIICIPTSNYISFSSYPDYTDNAYAVYLYMLQHSYNQKYKFIWLIMEKKKLPALKKQIQEQYPSTKVVEKISFLGFYYYVKSRYIFYTHGCWDSVVTKQHPDKMINMWHGMPLKRCCYMDNECEGNNMRNTQITIATSDFFRGVMAQSFRISIEKVLLIGQPRNDLFFSKTNFFEKNNINFNSYKSIGIWLPTYRKSIVGNIRVSGNYEDGCISILNEQSIEILNTFLQENDELLLIKLHPMDVLQNFKFKEFTNIVIIKQNQFKFQLYPLIGACDYLLTDYSSVWVDFDICNKPIGFVMDDFEEYKNDRGFTVANIVEFMPNSIIDNIEDLMNFITNPYKTKKETSNQYNVFKDNNAAKRLLDSLELTQLG